MNNRTARTPNIAGKAGLAYAIFVITASSVAAATAAPAPKLDIDRVAPGFVAESRDPRGFRSGTGFAATNPWGQYTAYLMLTDKLGRRTWRLEHNLPNVGNGSAQGSTMYLLEGSKRALLIDTANPAKATEGVNDLKTVVRYLLAHDNTGKSKAKPLDFVVANTHNHPDHIGENARMSDRTVYYMDGDWPAANAPPNYVPVKEGGGPALRGPGTAVGEIDLGGRVLKAIDVPPHSAGSIAWLDPETQMLISGDALGSSWPFLQRGPLTRFAQTARHVLDVTAPYPDLKLFPSHFFQLGTYDRANLPRDQQILGRQYVADLAAAATGVINGDVAGTPVSFSPRDYWAAIGAAKLVYNLDTVGRPGEALPSNYRIAIVSGPGLHPLSDYVTPGLNKIIDQGADVTLLRGTAGESLFLIKGSKRALLVGTGAGEAGLQKVVDRLRGDLPVDIAILDASDSQIGGLKQLSPAMLYTGAGVPLADTRASRLKDGDIIDLGLDSKGAPLRLEAQSLAAPGAPALTLLLPSSRLLFIGSVMGTMAPGAALTVKKFPAVSGSRFRLAKTGRRAVRQCLRLSEPGLVQ